MIYRIVPPMFDRYPELRIGIVVGRDLKIARTRSDLRSLIGENVRMFLNTMKGRDLLEYPNISAWRETYKSFGVKPKENKPTTENLLRRVMNGHAFPNINTAVDAYLAVELLYMLPIGGYDMRKIEGDVELRVSGGGELFYPLGGGDPEYTKEGEIIYSDNNRVLTRKWNYRDSEHTKITENTVDILLATEAALKIINDDDVYNTTKQIVEYEKKFCGGMFQTYQLDINHHEIVL